MLTALGPRLGSPNPLMRQRSRTLDISDHRLGLLAVTAAAGGWAGAAVVARGLFEAGIPPLVLAGARAVIAAAGLSLLALRRPSSRGGGWRVLVPLGLCIALVNATYYLAIDRLAVAVAIILQYTAPVMVVAWTAAARRRLPRPEIVIALVLAVAGVGLASGLAGGLGRLDAAGIGFGLASAVLFAVYTVLSEHAGGIHGAIGAMRGAFLVAAAFWVIVLAPGGLPAQLGAPRHLAAVLFVGVAGTLAPFLLYVWGIQRVRAERATIAASLEPVLAAMAAWLWLGQMLEPLQMLGGVLVIAGILLLQTRRADPIRAPEV